MNSFDRIICSLVMVVVAGFCEAGLSQEVETPEAVSVAVQEELSQWQFRAPLTVPASSEDGAEPKASTALIDFFVTPGIFEHARSGLGDLRMIRADGGSLPFALRILSDRTVRETVVTSEFNRSEPQEGVHELALELLVSEVSHNEVVVETSGTSFRRQVTVSGSDDGKDWKPLASGVIIRFQADDETLVHNSFVYPVSRHRYVRVQVTPDPESVKLLGQPDEFSFVNVNVVRSVVLPGEQVSYKATMSEREPARAYTGAAGSRWIFDFGAEIPCERLEIEIKDQEFARDVTLEIEALSVLGQPNFVPVYLDEDSVWKRQPGDGSGPMLLKFSELAVKRLRLTVADHRNKPLTLTSVTGFGAARQVIFERPQESDLPLQVYFGNASADNPNYDFARNLPEMLPQVPTRATLSAVEPNPEFTPPPVPWTERFPWMIYVVLASVSVVLGAVIVNLSRAAIASHDSASAAEL